MPSFLNPSGSFMAESGGTPIRVVAPSTGDTVSMAARDRVLYVNNSGTLAELTVQLPRGVDARERVEIVARSAITALTVNDGYGVAISTAPSAAAARAIYQFVMVTKALGWFYLPYSGGGAGGIDGLTATVAELNYLDITTLGTGAASKAVVLNSGDDYVWPPTGILRAGELRIVGKTMFAQGAPAAKTVTAAITAAELAGGLITTTGATAPSEHQLPTGTLLLAEFPGAVAGMAFDFTVINTGTGAGDDATITVNTDVTIVGNPTIGALTDVTILSGSGRFRARYTTGVTWVVYRIA